MVSVFILPKLFYDHLKIKCPLLLVFDKK